MSKIFLIGSKGFIGSHLSKLEGVIPLNRENFNLLSASSFPYEVGEEDSIIYAAGIPRSKSNKEDDKKSNIEMIRNLITSLKNKKYLKFIFLSSVEVYGDNPILPIHERTEINPHNLYAESKVKGEETLKNEIENLIILRLPGVYGKGSSGGFVKAITDRIIKKEPVILKNNGKTLRDFIYVGDLVNIISKFISSDIKSGLFNISSGQSYTLEEYFSFMGGRSYELSSDSRGEFDLVFDNELLIKSLPNISFTDPKDSLTGWIEKNG